MRERDHDSHKGDVQKNLITRSYEIHIVVVNPFRLVCLLDLCNCCENIELSISKFFHLLYVHFHHGCVWFMYSMLQIDWHL
jgi:hypothetical protein